ncbi:hypothetical protein TIFTF001_031894 [Ficus carica]|uniref:Uncharacterized protein n=1 Tax=Ficus carica TaxID=3494 RepID=A0AA88J4Y7_FICCA|nr:hypothetical protein TIFTF001_031894 [Ficus carica]
MSSHHLNGRARGICPVEVKYAYTRNMFTHRDHSKYNPLGSLEHPNLWKRPINKGVPHSLSKHPTGISLTLRYFSFAGDWIEHDGDGLLHGGGFVHNGCDIVKKMVGLEIEEDVWSICEEILEKGVVGGPSTFEICISDRLNLQLRSVETLNPP